MSEREPYNGLHISHAWRTWLESQDTRQLETSLGERERLVMTQKAGSEEHTHTLREMEMIRAEFKRREEAERVRAEFFPRISIRNVRDAKLLAQLLHSHAQEVLSMSQQVLQYKKLSDAGFPIVVQFMDPMTGENTDDIDAVLSDLAERAIYTAELLGSVSEEMLRLKSDEGVELDERENEIFGQIVRLVENMKEEGK